jgi:hypothetical protein
MISLRSHEVAACAVRPHVVHRLVIKSQAGGFASLTLWQRVIDGASSAAVSNPKKGCCCEMERRL